MDDPAPVSTGATDDDGGRGLQQQWGPPQRPPAAAAPPTIAASNCSRGGSGEQRRRRRGGWLWLHTCHVTRVYAFDVPCLLFPRARDNDGTGFDPVGV
jgi:hypothetical protein